MTPRILAVLCALALAAAPSAAQMVSTASHVSVGILPSHSGIPQGGSMTAAIVMDIEETWHVNAHRPTFDYLIGTSVDLRPGPSVIVSEVRYPKGRSEQFGFADEPIDVYDGRVVIFVSLRVSSRAALGADTLRGTLTTQACNDQVCLAPSRIPLAVPLTLVAAGEPVTALHDDIFAAASSAEYEYANDDQGEIAALIETEGSVVAFLAIFLIGLALNLTPCVYPMMSVTVSLFGGQEAAPLRTVFFKSVVYVLGIATMYTTLGVSAAFSGGLFGSWLQSPWVLGGIGLLLFGLALSSFGLYQITVPYWVTSRLGGQTGTGLVALYVSGLVVGVFAAPCIGPPVIALLTLVGAKGDPMFGFQAFFSLSMGLGFPYLILGTFSGLLKKVPRSGPWLVWVERIFGVVLVGAALFYIALALAPKYSAYVVPVVLVLGGLYLGFLEPSGRGKKALQRVQWAFGVVSIVFGIMTARSFAAEGVAWEPYADERVAEAAANGQPVIIDFFADWCIPCIELDRNTFTDPGVVEATRDAVRLKVDLTHFDSPEAEAIRQRYDISGVPTIVFLDGNGDEVRPSRIVGFVPPSDFLRRLRPAFTR